MPKRDKRRLPRRFPNSKEIWQWQEEAKRVAGGAELAPPPKVQGGRDAPARHGPARQGTP
jgi:hypothetical protein